MENQINDTTTHQHNGQDAPKLDPRNFLGYQIFTAAPTYAAIEGTIVLGYVGGAYKLYAYINGGWRAVTLT
jgi:NADH:ubiquinone oxidoreductase subunit F (NADH-binding)